MSISYNGYDTKYITMLGYDLMVGDIIKPDSNNDAAKAMDTEDFVGVVVSARDNIVSVQEHGYIEMEYTGEMPNKAFVKLVSDGNNKVKNDDVNGTKEYKILKKDDYNKIIGFIL